jgi:hypothetical protein
MLVSGLVELGKSSVREMVPHLRQTEFHNTHTHTHTHTHILPPPTHTMRSGFISPSLVYQCTSGR